MDMMLNLPGRLKAGAIHLLLSLLVVAAVYALVRLGWYPGALFDLSGVGTILLLLVLVDAGLGPLLTLVVFDTRKPELRRDLALIACVQIAALVYGVWTLEEGRPHWVVFARDRFEMVSRADVLPQDRTDAATVAAAQVHWVSPSWVGVSPPVSAAERNQLLMEAVQGGRDLPQLPRLYVPLDEQKADMLKRLRPLTALEALNPPQDWQALQERLKADGLSIDAVGFLPLKGPARDGVLLLDRTSAQRLGVWALTPW